MYREAMITTTIIPGIFGEVKTFNFTYSGGPLFALSVVTVVVGVVDQRMVGGFCGKNTTAVRCRGQCLIVSCRLGRVASHAMLCNDDKQRNTQSLFFKAMLSSTSHSVWSSGAYC